MEVRITMNAINKPVDMLHGSLLRSLTVFAIPIALCSMLQQLFNSTDTAVVGRFADANALAAVGANGELIALLISLSAGLSVGTNVLLAHFIGCQKSDPLPDIIHTSLALALLIGIPFACIGQLIAVPVLTLIQTPASILSLSALYLRIYFAGYPFLLLYDFASAVLRARGNSRSPFLALVLSGMLNLLLNLFFVIICHLGVAGVAIATDIATAFSAGIVLWILHTEKSAFHFSPVKLRLHGRYVCQILKIGIPAAIQGAVFCFANVFVQTAVNSFGTDAVAGSAIAMNFEYFGYYMITAYGQGATTFVSQNFAAGSLKRCRQILFTCLASSFLLCGAITTPLVIWRSFASAFFSADPQVIRMACIRIMFILAFEPFCCLYEIPAGVLRGMGHSTFPAAVTIVGTCLLRILWIMTVFPHFHTFRALFIIFPVSWIITAVPMWIGLISMLKKSGDIALWETAQSS